MPRAASCSRPRCSRGGRRTPSVTPHRDSGWIRRSASTPSGARRASPSMTSASPSPAGASSSRRRSAAMRRLDPRAADLRSAVDQLVHAMIDGLNVNGIAMRPVDVTRDRLVIVTSHEGSRSFDVLGRVCERLRGQPPSVPVRTAAVTEEERKALEALLTVVNAAWTAAAGREPTEEELRAVPSRAGGAPPRFRGRHGCGPHPCRGDARARHGSPALHRAGGDRHEGRARSGVVPARRADALRSECRIRAVAVRRRRSRGRSPPGTRSAWVCTGRSRRTPPPARQSPSSPST